MQVFINILACFGQLIDCNLPCILAQHTGLDTKCTHTCAGASRLEGTPIEKEKCQTYQLFKEEGPFCKSNESTLDFPRMDPCFLIGCFIDKGLINNASKMLMENSLFNIITYTCVHPLADNDGP